MADQMLISQEAFTQASEASPLLRLVNQDR